MKKIILIVLFVLGVMMFAFHGMAEDKQLTATQILEKVDDVINAPKDQDLKIKLILIDKNGKESTREMSMLQKGSDKRLLKFLYPADQRGIAFLSLPKEVMYLYLPAFKKTRRIASHIKNNKFAGTDFTYEDMEAVRLAEKYNPELMKEEENYFILQLIPKAGIRTDYSKLIMWVRTDNFYPTKIEHYDKGNNLYKVMTREKIKKINGFWISMESEMDDRKANHKTKMILENVEFNSGIPDDKFTERYLTR